MNKINASRKIIIYAMIIAGVIISAVNPHKVFAEDPPANSPAPVSPSSGSANGSGSTSASSSSTSAGEGGSSAEVIWNPDGTASLHTNCGAAGTPFTLTASRDGMTATHQGICTGDQVGEARCGNGVKANGEFHVNCMINGLPDTCPYVEACDDGNNADGDGCSSTCEIEKCGDGKLQPFPPFNEQCDNGAANGAPGNICDRNCKTQNKFCGNGVVEKPNDAGFFEVCDQGVGVNGVKQMNPALPQNICNADCTEAVCGNGAVEALTSEQCDAGANNGMARSGCTNLCMIPFCGNGAVEPENPAGEQCDFGVAFNGKPGSGCNADCSMPMCGNTFLETTGVTGPEQCDDGNTVSGDGCSAACQLEHVCCNGTVEPGEECDPGNTGGSTSIGYTCSDSDRNCDTSCKLRCGNGTIDLDGSGTPLEDCEKDSDCTGSDTECKSCQCVPKSCGNGTVDVGEECDDGNSISDDGCDLCDLKTCNETNSDWHDTYSGCSEGGCYKQVAEFSVTGADGPVISKCYKCVDREDTCENLSKLFSGESCAKYVASTAGETQCEGGCYTTASCGKMCPADGSFPINSIDIMDSQSFACCSCSSIQNEPFAATCSNGTYAACNTIAPDSSNSNHETGFQPVTNPRCEAGGSSSTLTVNADGTCSPACEACTCGAAGATKLCNDIIE